MGREIVSKIIYNREIAGEIFEIRVAGEKDLSFVPGQFGNIKIDSKELLLRRPISINAYDKKSGEMVFLYKVVGKGTRKLTEAKTGDDISILAPLGNGFNVLENYMNICLVGGGIGCAPLESIMDKYPEKSYRTFLGFDTKKSIYHKSDFERKSDKFFITTEDGSLGEKGFVTEPLKKQIETDPPDVVYACGPTPMLKALKNTIYPYEIKAFVSVEERMGCGIGGCAVCVCKTTTGYKKACVVGPVFELDKVVF